MTPNFAQNYINECANHEPLVPDTPNAYSYSTDLQSLSNFDEPIVFNLFIWGVNKDDGSAPDAPNGLSMTLDRALRIVQLLNLEYNKHYIYFKFTGMDFINNTTLYSVTRGPTTEEAIFFGEFFDEVLANNDYHKSDALNIYAYHAINFAGSALSNRNVAGIHFVNYDSIGVLSHEVGHNFHLYHTDNGHFNPYDGNPQNGSNSELVNRDPSNGLPYNAPWAGDRITDTPAGPQFRREHYYELRELGYTHLEAEAMYIPFKYINETGDCEYFNTEGKDALGANYIIFPDDVKNIMAAGGGHCRNQGTFTQGQVIRMREAIQNDVYGFFANTTTTIASLYEPYQGAYYYAGPLPNPANPPLFQPGFNYNFKDCSGNYPEPSAYEDTSFTIGVGNHFVPKEIDPQFFNTITHPNHKAIKILFNPSLPPSYGQNTRKCYDNNNRSPIGGSLTKFNDDVFNTNVTIIPQDSTSINNANLINTLDPGLYKIEKIYEDGDVQQNIIIKDHE